MAVNSDIRVKSYADPFVFTNTVEVTLLTHFPVPEFKHNLDEFSVSRPSFDTIFVNQKFAYRFTNEWAATAENYRETIRQLLVNRIQTYLVPRIPGAMIFPFLERVSKAIDAHLSDLEQDPNGLIGALEAHKRFANGATSFSRHSIFLQTVTHPLYNELCPLRTVIMDLNDRHGWTREQIADWIETLDIHINLKPKEQVNG